MHESTVIDYCIPIRFGRSNLASQMPSQVSIVTGDMYLHDAGESWQDTLQALQLVSCVVR